MLNKHWQKTCAGLALALLASTGSAYGSGFGIFTQGATELGQANASVAHTNGPSAVYFNPALMSKLTGTQAEFGTTLVAPDREFSSAANGQGAQVDSTIYFPSNLYLTHALNDKMAVGLAIFNPFGLGTEWSETWEGRYLATKSTITTFNINPALAYKVTPQITLAAGLDLLLLDAELENKIDLTGLGAGTPDANQKFSADGEGLGYNLGLLIDLTPEWTFGAAYRSEVDITAKGDVQFTVPSTIPEPFFSLISGSLPNSSAQSKLTLPQQLTAGLAWKQSEQLTVEAGVRWEGWSAFDALTVRFPDGSTDSIPKNWHDTWAANLGARYQLNPKVALLGGYLWGEDAIPADTFEPGVPDSTSHLFTLGSEMQWDRFQFAASYGYQQLEKRDKNNNVGANLGGTANGSYESSIHLVGLSLGYKF